jgi:hypothetical protein
MLPASAALPERRRSSFSNPQVETQILLRLKILSQPVAVAP